MEKGRLSHRAFATRWKSGTAGPPCRGEGWGREARGCRECLTNKAPVSDRYDFLAGDNALLRALDRIFNGASVYVMIGPSFRGADCDTFSMEAVPTVSRARRQWADHDRG